ncbi:unnamed protein product [Bursaphelenchus xylophilus]|uniref:(pine wood nematode) hypothetical protein n=1 Tax=Bursaphelenchus xylophilus TaxID=6326 RepID=A0A1I7RL47_BURXY|nr:unnamed protein product [Bursaphelenchus xylophilus]CAG9083470.1 unnamed protein product [Bursaphelenchus xylophilus]
MDGRPPVAYPYNATDFAVPSLVPWLGGVALLAVISNAILLTFLLYRRLYQHFISSQFIIHLCLTNIIGITVLFPQYLHNLWTGENLWLNNNALCRVQAFFICSIWSVVNFATVSIAGVHLLTFNRIHYDQLFGMNPNHLCYLSWLVGFAVSLPCITNGNIVVYNPALRHCIWGISDYSYKFLTYVIILGVIIPALLSYYSYLKILKTLYHSPIVFQSLGLYKSRFIIYTFFLSPFYQAPLIYITLTGHETLYGPQDIFPIVSSILAYCPMVLTPLIYSLSMVLIKEEDMVITARAHKSTNAYTQVAPGHRL